MMLQNATVRTVVDTVLLGQFGANLGMGAGHLVGEGLTQVVEQTSNLGNLDVGTSSAASIPDSNATSIECLSTFSP